MSEHQSSSSGKTNNFIPPPLLPPPPPLPPLPSVQPPASHQQQQQQQVKSNYVPPPPPSTPSAGTSASGNATRSPYVSSLPPPPPPPPPSISANRSSSTRNEMSTTPPRSGTTTAGSTSTTGNNSLNSSLLFHSVSSAMPSLVSAPASANISFDDIASRITAASNSLTAASNSSSEILQGAVDFFNTTSNDTTTTMSNLMNSSFGSTNNASTTGNKTTTQSTILYGTTVKIPPASPPPARLNPSPSHTTTSSGGTVVRSFPAPPPPHAMTPSSNSIPPPPELTSRTSSEHFGPTVVTAIPPPTSPSRQIKSSLPYIQYVSESSLNLKPNSRLPYTQFRPKEPLQTLSSSQTSIPILIIATERAHEMAWKNGLYISDMFEGLVQKNLLPNMTSTGSTSNNSSTSLLPPFRSANRTISTLTWDDLPTMTFLEPDELSSSSLFHNKNAASQLAAAVVLQESDGNLQHELEVLEDQIDILLYDDGNNADAEDHNLDNSQEENDYYSKYQRIQRRQEQAYKDAYQLTSPLNIPWLWRYRQTLDETSTGKGQQHDMFNCPVIVLSICTTAEDLNTFDTIKMLQNEPFYLPSVYYKTGLYDPNAVRHEILVLHDTISGPKNWDETALRKSLQRSYGPAASVLRINSIPPDTAKQLALEETNDLWGGHGKLGNCLSVGDRASIRKYFTQFIQNAVLPAIERRIADLNAIVNDRKKGVKNVLKSLWGGGRPTAVARKETTDDDEYNKSKTGGESSESAENSTGIGTVLYRYDAIESQTRLLGDTLFLMKDYDGAMSMYRLIKDDYKQDKAWIHYGSVQETIALCLYCIDPYRNAKEIFTNIESALLAYSRAASEDTSRIQEQGEAAVTTGPGERSSSATLPARLATRLCLVLASTRNICNGRHMEVADLLASASSSESSLGAAVLLEQSSAHYYHAEMYRKYAFHMLMSGHMFRTATNADHHAFRCFTSALHIYNGHGNDGGKWDELQNHLRSALASLLFSMGRMAISLQLYAKLLGTTEGGRVSIKSQQKFLANLFEICNDHRKKALAGVDRMAASSKVTSAEERKAIRKENLDRIVQVIQYTRSASRVLEIPNMDLPCISDSSVVVIAEEEVTLEHRQNTSIPHFGLAKLGSQEVWDELMLWTMAELKAAKLYNLADSDTVSPSIRKALQKIEDEEIRNVVILVEKEKEKRAMEERSKRRGKMNNAQSAPVRAQMEPISVEFTIGNPLGLPIDINDLQLVAKMETFDERKPSKKSICTNENAVHIKPLAKCNEKKTWTFRNSIVEYEIAEFCRISTNSSGTGDSHDSWKSAEDFDHFFVVTKSNHTIQRESSIHVSISICPLVQGNLDILGVRCRLLDNIWIYHPFTIKGPLLQNTRSNRANRIRGESFLLKSKVGRGMPCVTVDLVPRSAAAASSFSGPVLHAQIGLWALRVSNVGTAPATNITLKTNTPWINIVKEHDIVMSERSPISHCVGPTGTLMRLPIEEFSTGLTVPSQIHPGETVDIPIEIRTSDDMVGKQNLYMLFRYELASTEDYSAVHQPSRFRWLKKMFEVPIYPSLSLTASIVPAFASFNGEHLLSLDITNGRLDRPDKPGVNLNAVSLASRHYRLEPIPGQLRSSNDIATFELGWQERATIHYRLVAKSEKCAKIVSECSLIPNQGEENSVDNDSFSLLNFMCLERAHESFEEAISVYHMALSKTTANVEEKPRSIASIRRANTFNSAISSSFGYDSIDNVNVNDGKIHPTSIDRLCPADAFDSQLIHIVCSWSDSTNEFSGIHHIRGLSIVGNRNLCPITISASHPQEVSNDFKNGPAIVPLRVTLRNRLAAGDVLNSVDVEFSVEKPESFDFVTAPQEGYRRTLKGGEELCIPLKAMLPFSGVYNLQQMRLRTFENKGSSTLDQQQPTTYEFSQQWMVSVRSK